MVLFHAERRNATDDDVETSQGEEPGAGGAGVSRRTMIRRSAIAGGALLWATPVVQSLGNDSAYAWFRGSQQPGTCHCKEQIHAIVPVHCAAKPTSSGKVVKFQAQTETGCGAGAHCSSEGEDIAWSQVSASKCKLVSQSGTTCVVHVTGYPASITLQVTSTNTCIGPRGKGGSSCTDTRLRMFCFTQVTGTATDRCGPALPHKQTYGTQRCS